MTIIIWLPLLVCLVGLVVYLICVSATRASVGEVGRLAFAVGLLAFLLLMGGQVSSCSTGPATVGHVR